MIKIYTDGSCIGNGRTNNYGGWSYVAYRDNKILNQRYGGEKDTTNNKMELKAVIEAFKFAFANSELGEELKIYTDSAYIYNCINEKWYLKWYRNNWTNSNGVQVKNKEMWEELLEYCSSYKDFEILKVKAHTGIVGNEIADMLAVKGSKEAKEI